MGKQQRAKSVDRKGRNDVRQNGKAFKKKPKKQEANRTGRTVGGFSASRIVEREEKRQGRLLDGFEI